MYDFQTLETSVVKELNEKRAEALVEATNGFFVENDCYYPLLNELRYNHDYWMLHPFLLHAELGLKWELYEYPEKKSLHLAFISVPEDKRQQGYGHQMMKMLTTLADKYEYTVNLNVDAKFGVGKRILTRFYKAHGFLKQTSYGKDYFERIPRT